MRLTNEASKDLAFVLKDLSRYRDWAVHPVTAFRAPEYRADLDAMVDWHFAAFRSGNAQHAAGEISLILRDLVMRLPEAQSEEVRGYAERALESVNQVVARADAAALSRNPRA